MLANERTFLAWTRTSPALLATGLAITEFLESLSRGLIAVITMAAAVPLLLSAHRRALTATFNRSGLNWLGSGRRSASWSTRRCSRGSRATLTRRR